MEDLRTVEMASRKVETLTKLAMLLLNIKLHIHNLCVVNSITHTHFDSAQSDNISTKETGRQIKGVRG
jgi:hypothetical protein